jgi:hypothetical protein
MIALGTAANGHAPEDDDIADARSLPGVAALDLLAAVAELSLPRSIVRPFVALVTDGDGGGVRRYYQGAGYEIAEMALALARAGYGSLDEIMSWTPLRMSQVIFIHGKLLEVEQQRDLAMHAFAAQGDPKELRKALVA